MPDLPWRPPRRRHGLGQGRDAYAIPLYYAYDGEALYFHSHIGAKDAFLQETHEASFVVVEVEGTDDWTSVQVTGPVEKVSRSGDAQKAFEALAENPLPPEFGVDVKGNPKRGSKDSYLWMMRPRKVTGRTSRSLVRLKDPGKR